MVVTLSKLSAISPQLVLGLGHALPQGGYGAPKCETKRVPQPTSYKCQQDQECTTQYEEQCKTVYDEQCSTKYEEQCEVEYQEQCQTKYEVRGISYMAVNSIYERSNFLFVS